MQRRRLAANLPLQALVLRTDAPDMPPQWLYGPVAQRQAGHVQRANSPVELPRIGEALAHLRKQSVTVIAAQTTLNARDALPRLT